MSSIQEILSEFKKTEDERDKQYDAMLEYFGGRMKRIVEHMKVLDLYDEDTPNKIWDSKVKKIRNEINKEQLDIDLELKKIHARQEKLNIIDRARNHRSQDMWFYYLREEMIKLLDLEMEGY